MQKFQWFIIHSRKTVDLVLEGMTRFGSFLHLFLQSPYPTPLSLPVQIMEVGQEFREYMQQEFSSQGSNPNSAIQYIQRMMGVRMCTKTSSYKIIV